LEHLEIFDVAASTGRLYSISASITQGSEQAGMRPGAEEMMKKQIEPARTVYDRLHKLTDIRLPLVEDWLD
jgi:hypothetical protein